MKVFIEKEQRTLSLDHAGTARSLLEKISVNPETVIIVKDGTLITEDDDVEDAGKIDLLSVVSGG